MCCTIESDNVNTVSHDYLEIHNNLRYHNHNICNQRDSSNWAINSGEQVSERGSTIILQCKKGLSAYQSSGSFSPHQRITNVTHF